MDLRGGNGKSERQMRMGLGAPASLRLSTQSPTARLQELPGHTQEGVVVFEWSHGGWGSERCILVRAWREVSGPKDLVAQEGECTPDWQVYPRRILSSLAS